MKYIILAVLSFFLVFACKSDKNAKVDAKPVLTSASETLPPVPESFIIDLYQKVDHIDYYFRNTNFSISQDEKTATQAFISMLSPGNAVSTSDACVSPLRMTFLSEGNILVETEMYMTDNCQYVEYYIDGKKTYQSNHSEQGYRFLLNLIKQGESARPGAQG